MFHSLFQLRSDAVSIQIARADRSFVLRVLEILLIIILNKTKNKESNNDFTKLRIFFFFVNGNCRARVNLQRIFPLVFFLVLFCVFQKSKVPLNVRACDWCESISVESKEFIWESLEIKLDLNLQYQINVCPNNQVRRRR